MINSGRAKDSLTSGRPMLLRSLIRPKYVTVRASALAQSGPRVGEPKGDVGFPSSVAHRGETAYVPDPPAWVCVRFNLKVAPKSAKG